MSALSPGNKIIQIQYLRGLAVMLVVLAHIHQSDARFLTPSLLGDYAYFGFSGVDLFFVISGFIIHWLYRSHDKPDAGYFLKRLNRIYPLYWIFTLAALAGYFTMGDALTAEAGELNLVESFTLAPSSQAPILMVGWTLTHELYFYLAYGLALLLPRRLRIWAGLAWGGASLAFMWVEPGALGPRLAVLLSPFNLLFLAGAFLAGGLDTLQTQRWPALALSLAGAVLGLWWMSVHGIEGLTDPRWRVAMLGPFAIGTVWAFLAWSPRLPDFASLLGDWSYSIYLSHILAIGVLARLAPGVIGTGVLASLGFYAICLAACIILGWLSHRMLEQPLLKLGRGLIRRG